MVPCALASLAPSLEVTEEVRREQKGRERPGNFHGCGKTRPGPVPFSCALRPKVVAATVGAGVPGPHSNEQSPPLSQPPLGPPQPAPLRPSDRNSHPSPTLRPPFWSSGGSPLLFHSRKLNTPPPNRSDRHASPDTLDSPIRSPPRQRSHSCPQARAPHPTFPARPGASPGSQVRPLLSSRGVSPQTSFPASRLRPGRWRPHSQNSAMYQVTA